LKIGNRDQSNATGASVYSSRTSEASAFAQAAALDRSALIDLAWAFVEDVGLNLIGKLPVSAIVQMVAGKSRTVEAIRYGVGCADSALSVISRIRMAFPYISFPSLPPSSGSLVALQNKCVNCAN
jgi:hypothetical protein